MRLGLEKKILLSTTLSIGDSALKYVREKGFDRWIAEHHSLEHTKKSEDIDPFIAQVSGAVCALGSWNAQGEIAPVILFRFFLID